MSRQNVGITVTHAVDKILRDTLKSLPEGQASLDLLDRMRKAEKNGWVLYHHDYIKWWPDELQHIGNIDECLGTLLDDEDDKYRDQILVVVVNDYLPDEIATTRGATGNDPFNLGYVLRVDYDLPSLLD